MLENTFEQMDLITPADALELSMDDLEEVNGAWGGFSCGIGGFAFGGIGSCSSCGSCSWGSCLTVVDLTVSFNECLKFVTFGGWGSCGSCEGLGWN